MITKTKSAFAVAVATAALAVSLGAQAATDGAAPAMANAGNTMPAPDGHHWAPPGEHGGPGGPGFNGPHGPGARFGGMMKHLHDELQLNASQEQAWKNAQEVTKRNFAAARAIHEKSRKQFETLFRQPVLDLAALRDAREQVASSDRGLRANTEDSWLAFYGTLSDVQKAVVSTKIKDHLLPMFGHGGPRGRGEFGGPHRMDRMDHMDGPRGDHRGPPPGGEHGGMPPPPPQGASAPQ
jgi:uncharacterized membrane protein